MNSVEVAPERHSASFKERLLGGPLSIWKVGQKLSGNWIRPWFRVNLARTALTESLYISRVWPLSFLIMATLVTVFESISLCVMIFHSAARVFVEKKAIHARNKKIRVIRILPLSGNWWWFKAILIISVYTRDFAYIATQMNKTYYSFSKKSQ